MKRTLLLVLALLLTASAAWAQSYTLYSTDNSPLPANPLYAIDFDNNGNVWFSGQRNAATGLANVSQLSRDGKTWKVYQPAELALDALEDRVFYTAVDDQNTKWFCTHYGVSFLKADGTAGIVDFTKDKYTRTVQTDAKGNVYISQREDTRTDSRLYVSADHGQTWTPWKLADLGFSFDESSGRPEAYDLRQDSKGQLWICTWFGVTRKTPDGSWKAVAALEDKYTYAMTIDPDDHVWVPDNDTADLYEILPDETVIRHDSTTIAPLKFKVIDLEADLNGHIWCATNGGGLVEIKPDRSFNQYTAENTAGKIPENSINVIEIRDGVIWIATSASGVVRLGNVASLSTLVKEEASPKRYDLVTNYPNPFNPSTTIRFDLPKQSVVELSVYSLDGRLVRKLANRALPSGVHAILWDGNDDRGIAVASGIYLYRLNYDGASISKKMTLLK